MPVKPSDVDSYIAQLPDDRKEAVGKLRTVVKKNLPKGFEERVGYNMPCYVVPHSIYPKGYHCDAKVPLPFISIASQKSHVSLHHLGLYGSGQLLDWFVTEYAKRGIGKLDMGKGCVRWKKMDQIPYDLIGELAAKITPQDWIRIYEAQLKGRKA